MTAAGKLVANNVVYGYVTDITNYDIFTNSDVKTDYRQWSPSGAFSTLSLKIAVGNIHPLTHDAMKEAIARPRDANLLGKLPNFTKGDFVLMTQDDFTAGGKLSLRWRGFRCVVEALPDFVYQVEDLRFGIIDDVHGSRLKFYQDEKLDTVVIMPHVASMETVIPV